MRGGDDKAKAADIRENSASGRLEIDKWRNGGLTKLQRLAGERYAEQLNRYRTRILLSPNPNPPACDMRGSAGKSSDGDPFMMPNDELARLISLKVKTENIINELLKLPRGELVRAVLDEVFILDRDIKDARIELVRSGANLLILELGLTCGGDGIYRKRT